MIRLAGIAVCCVFCSVLLKDKNRVIAVFVSVFGALLIFSETLAELKEITLKLNSISREISSVGSYLKLMIKVLIITLLTQVVSDICRDNGENALASVTEASSKVIVIVLVLPLFEAVITIVGGLVK